MIHRITLHFLILSDYAKRKAFPRYASSGQLNDLSVRVSTDELRSIVDDAETHAHISIATYPNLAIAYGRLARKGREMLKYDDEHYAGNRATDLKSQAAGEKDD